MSQQPPKATALEQQSVSKSDNSEYDTSTLKSQAAQSQSRMKSHGSSSSTATANSSKSANGADVTKPVISWADRARAAGASKTGGSAAASVSSQETKEQQDKDAEGNNTPPNPKGSSGVTLPAGVSSKNEQIQFGDFKRGELNQNQNASQRASPPKMQTAGLLKTVSAAKSESHVHLDLASKTGNTDASESGGHPSTANQPTSKTATIHQHPRGFPTGGGRPRNPPHQPVPVATGYQQNSLAYAAMNTVPFPITGYSYGAYSGGYGGNPAGQYPFYPPQHTPAGVGSSMSRGHQPVQMHLAQANTAPASSFSGSSQSATASAAPKVNLSPVPSTRVKKILKIENPETHEVLDLEHLRDERKEKEAAEKTKDAKEQAALEARSTSDDTARVKEPVITVTDSEIEMKDSAESIPVGEKDDSRNGTLELPDTKSEQKSPTQIIETSKAKDESTEKEVTEDIPAPSLLPSGTNTEAKAKVPSNGRTFYTTEFLLEMKEKCKSMPSGFEVGSAAELIPRTGGPRGLSGPMSRDWKSQRMTAPPMPGPPGMRGRGAGRRPPPPAGPDADTWERGKPLPPLRDERGGFDRRGPPGMRGPMGPLPALHKTDSAYKVGRVQTDDPEEEKAQKSLKSMLNKITPQNFEKITSQIIDKINERKKAKTLSGFIDQIFDKALSETTFSELYASLVATLNPALPSLEDDDGNPVQFRRTLLNKCQDEFDRGAKAMQAVAEREKRDDSKSTKEDERELEEGEITEEQRQERETQAEAKRQDKVAAEAEVVARKRMLGNIIFVGQLYRFGILTEGVMHSCVRQLLEETQKPRSEDVECLCKLLSTIGRPMEASQRPTTSPTGEKISAKDMMAVYFKRIQDLSENDALDSRHRFMLKDLIDMRKNGWMLRRKAEGPKKIEEIHRDAAMERSRSQTLDRQPSRGSREIPRAPRVPIDRVDAPIRTMNRINSQDSFAPQSLRPGGRPAPLMRRVNSASQPLEETASKSELSAQPISNEDMERKVKGLLEELYNSGDLNEAMTCLKELGSAQADSVGVVDTIISVSLERKGTNWEMLHKLLKTSAEAGSVEAITKTALHKGCRRVLDKLADTAVDVPLAPQQVADCLAALIDVELLELKKISEEILIADLEDVPSEEDTMLVGDGYAIKVLDRMLAELATKWGEEKLKEAWLATGLDACKFLPSDDRSEDNLPTSLAKLIK